MIKNLICKNLGIRINSHFLRRNLIIRGEKMNYSIGQLCKMFNIARSTLLYYEKIGLLRASNRGSNNYRIYLQEDVIKLKTICLYRQTGISLKEIRVLLDASEGMIQNVFIKQMEELNKEIEIIRSKQHMILGILQNEELLNRLQILEKETLVEVLNIAGLERHDLDRLHARIEARSPNAHQIFLEALGADKDTINAIREEARQYNEKIV